MKKRIELRRASSADVPVSIGSPDDLVRFLYQNRAAEYLGAEQYGIGKMHAPTSMHGLESACELLEFALQNQQRIIIVGDFDADGATSTALLLRCLKALGFKFVDFIVPNRFEYGYGLTPEIVELAVEKTPDLIITVDNGISSIDGVDRAKELGIKVLVTDHHLPGRELPKADAIVNPNQAGCEFPSKNLAGVGVVFYLMIRFRAVLREKNYFSTSTTKEPNLADFLDLVALGTVADVVPLDQNNRVLVAQGLKRIRAGQCIVGIKALMKIANRSLESASASDFGFAVGPRLNAAGRLDDMSLGIQCLLTDSEPQALQIAMQLDDLNKERRAIEQSMQVEALRILDRIDQSMQSGCSVCLYQADWHQGVVGILASRIKDRFHKPTIVFADADGGEIKGSGRSIKGLHLRDVLDEVATKNPGLLKKFGGHAMAAGLSIEKDNLAVFTGEFERVVDTHLSPELKEPIVLSDGSLEPDYLTLEYAEAIEKAGPWGQSFDEPIFHGDFRVVQSKVLAQKHLKLVLTLGQFNHQVVDAIAFNVDEEKLKVDDTKTLRACYKLSVNEFRGQRSVQLMLEYFEWI